MFTPKNYPFLHIGRMLDGTEFHFIGATPLPNNLPKEFKFAPRSGDYVDEFVVKSVGHTRHGVYFILEYPH